MEHSNEEQLAPLWHADLKRVSITHVRPDPDQPRTHVDEEELERLTASVKANGVLQPILVRLLGDGTLGIIAGERRYRASLAAGLSHIPVILVCHGDNSDPNDHTVRKLALMENLHREELNEVDATRAVLEYLHEELGYDSQDEVAKLLRRMKNRTTKPRDEADAEKVKQLFDELGKGWLTFTNNGLQLLSFHPELQEHVRTGRLEFTKVRALHRVKDDELRHQLTERAINEQLSREQLKKEIANHCEDSEAPHQQVINSLSQLKRYRARALRNLPTDKAVEIERTLVRLHELLTDAA